MRTNQFADLVRGCTLGTRLGRPCADCSIDAVETSDQAARHARSVRLPKFLRRSRYRTVFLSEYELTAEERHEWKTARAFQESLKSVYAAETAEPYSCPCCGHRTLPSRGNYDLCPECDWEDDGQDNHDSALIRGGPNGLLSLDNARAEYREQGGHPEPHLAPSPPE